MADKRKRLGDMLIEAGIVTPAQIDTALQAQKIFGGRLGTNLIEMGLIDDRTLSEFLSRQLGVPRVGYDELNSVDPELLSKIPAKAAMRLGIMPVRIDEDGKLVLAMIDPSDERVISRIEKNVGMKIRPCVTGEAELLYFLEKYYNVPRDIRHIKIMDKILAGRSARAPESTLQKWLDKITPADEALSTFASVPGILEQIPRRKEIIDLTKEDMPHEAAFVLYQMDGIINLEDLFIISGLDRVTTTRILVEFLKRGYMELVEP